MKQAKIPDKRIIRDRRKGGAIAYIGPERRKLKYRRSVDLPTRLWFTQL